MQLQRIEIYRALSIASMPVPSFKLIAGRGADVLLAKGVCLNQEKQWLAERHGLGASAVAVLLPQNNQRVSTADAFEAHVHEVVARIDMAPENWSTTVKSVGDISIAWDNRGRHIYPIAFEMRAQGIVSGHATESMLAVAARGAARLENEDGLTSVCRLLAESTRDEVHPVQAFMAAWTALEIFVVKTFPKYEQAFMGTRRGKVTPTRCVQSRK